jgi:hypothetical protein
VAETDIASAQGASHDEIFSRVIAPEVLDYAAVSRANLARHQLKLSASSETGMAATWQDGFMAGARYQQLKESAAGEEIPAATNS